MCKSLRKFFGPQLFYALVLMLVAELLFLGRDLLGVELSSMAAYNLLGLLSFVLYLLTGALLLAWFYRVFDETCNFAELLKAGVKAGAAIGVLVVKIRMLGSSFNPGFDLSQSWPAFWDVFVNSFLMVIIAAFALALGFWLESYFRMRDKRELLYSFISLFLLMLIVGTVSGLEFVGAVNEFAGPLGLFLLYACGALLLVWFYRIHQDGKSYYEVVKAGWIAGVLASALVVLNGVLDDVVQTGGTILLQAVSIAASTAANYFVAIVLASLFVCLGFELEKRLSAAGAGRGVFVARSFAAVRKTKAKRKAKPRAKAGKRRR